MARRKKKAKAAPSNGYGILDNHYLFCQYLVADETGNIRQAAIKAGFSPQSASQQASRALNNEKVKACIADLRKLRDERLQLQADDVLKRWVQIADADPNELIELRRRCCRYCYGTDHKYQRTPAEREAAYTGWDKTTKAGDTRDPFNEMGGLGFDARKDPHPECPECFGEGVVVVFPKDTRLLSEAARRLFAGVETTKDGLKIKLRDQDAALLNVGKHRGMLVNKHEHAGPNGGKIPIEIVGVEIVPPASVAPTAGKESLE